MSICPVCGCKTDELDFVLCTIEKNEEMVCSFCEKQIKKLYNDNTPALTQIRWLNSVIEKEVPSRPANILSALNDIKAKYSSGNEEKPTVSSVGKQVTNIKRDIASPESQSGAPEITVDQYNALNKRIDALEKSLSGMKKAQLMKTIIELGVPVVIAIIIAIVFFASGLYESLSALLSIV